MAYITSILPGVVPSFEAGELICEAERTLRDSGAGIAVVVERERYSGIVQHSWLAELLARRPDTAQQSLSALGALPAPQVHSGTSPLTIRRMLADTDLPYVPLLDGKGRVSKLLSREEALSLGLYDNPVAIMAGGFGMRLRPITQNIPKPLLPLVDSNMLEWILDHLVDCGFHRFYVAVHYLKDQIISYLGDGQQRGVSIEYIEEESPRGTAGSLRLLNSREEMPILVTNGDVITNQHCGEVLRHHQRHDAQLTVVCKEDSVDISYGVVECGPDGTLASISEKPRLSFLINTGIYVVEPSVLSLVPDRRYFMTDLINSVRDEGRKVSVFKTREYWRDVGTLDCYAQVVKDIHSGLVRSYSAVSGQNNNDGPGIQPSGIQEQGPMAREVR
jgi:dTDP-glucose pyrophosphorylase